MKKILLLCSAIVFLTYSYAQTWQQLGPLLVDQPSEGNCIYPEMVTDTAGNYYVAYQDEKPGSKITVRKYDGVSWKTLGTRGFSGTSVSGVRIAVSPDGTPYVGYVDIDIQKPVIRKYDGSTWVDLGLPATGGIEADAPDIAVDSKGIPYFDYVDAGGLKVAKYTGGAWVQVGGAVVTGFNNMTVKVCLSPTDSVYIAYSYSAPVIRTYMKKFDGTNWVLLGNTNVSDNNNINTFVHDAAVDGNGTPYVFYHNSGTNFYGIVKKFDGNSWVRLDSTGMLRNYQGITGQIEIDKNNVPYIAYEYWNNNYYMEVYRYDSDSSKWKGISIATSPALGLSRLFNVSLAFDKNGRPAIAFSKAYTYRPGEIRQDLAYVYQYDGTSWKKTGANNMNTDRITIRSLDIYNNTPYGIIQGYFSRTVPAMYNGNNWVMLGSDGFAEPDHLAIDKNGIVYIATEAMVYKYNGTGWTPVGDSINYHTEAYMAFDNNNVPYYMNTDGNGTLIVRKLNGNIWIQVGDTLAPANTYFQNISIAIDPQGTPYIAFADKQNWSGGGYEDVEVGVMKLAGNKWQFVGDSLFGDRYAAPAPLVLDNTGAPLVAHTTTRNIEEYYNNYNYFPYPVATLRKYTGSWTTLGADVPIPYFDYFDGSNMFSYNGAKALRLDKDGVPYLILSTDSNHYANNHYVHRSTVIKYENNEWRTVGTSNFDSGYNYFGVYGVYNSIAVDDNKVVYAATDQSWGYKYAQLPSDPAIGKITGADTMVCGGDSITLEFTVSGTFNTGNTFTVQMANYLFEGTENIGSIQATTGGTIKVKLPLMGGYWTDKWLRIVSSDPPRQGVYSKRLIVRPGPVIADAGPDQVLDGCQPITLGGSPTGTTQINQGAPAFAYITYQWAPATGLGIDSANPTVTGLTTTTTYTVTARDYYGCTAKDEVTVTVVNDQTSGVSITSTTQNGDSACYSTNITYTATPLRGGNAPVYTWYRLSTYGTDQLQTGASNKYVATPSDGNEIYCTMKPSADAPCPAVTATSNRIKVYTKYGQSRDIMISHNAGSDTICYGAPVTFTAIITNPPANISYRWVHKGNTHLEDTLPTFTSSEIRNKDYVYCIMRSLDGGCEYYDGYFYSNQIDFTVHPSITLKPGTTKVSCPGANVTLGGSPTASGGKAPYSYAWSGGAAATANPVVAPVTNTTYRLTVTDANNCTASDTIKVTMTTQPSVTIVANTSMPVCIGANAKFTANPVAGGTSPVYNWLVNGISAKKDTNSVFNITTLKDADTVSCILTSNIGCVSPDTAVSNKVGVFVSAILPPDITIKTTDSVICPGASVTFTATAVNAGLNPSYSWKINNTSMGVGSNSTFTYAAFQNNDQVWCVLISSSACSTTPRDTSGKIKMTVNTTAAPVVTITATDDTICRGSSATYTATATNAGTAQTYNWLFNGSSLQNTSSPTYKFNTAPARATNMKPNYAILCVMTVTGNCGSANKDTSNQLSLAILDKPIKPAIAGPTNDKCGGDTASFSCTAVPNATAYIWNFTGGGTVVSGQGTYKVVVLMSDTFVIGQLSVTAGNSCVTTTPAIHTVKCAHFKAGGDETTGIEEEGTTGISLNIYPNPNNGNMFIDIQQPEAGAISFTIYNIIGQPVYEYTAAGYTSSYSQWIALGNTGAGVYFLKAKIGNIVVTKNLVITK